MHPLNPVINTFVRLLDVPADLQHLSREAQLEAMSAPYARIRTLGGLARRAQESAFFMDEDSFWSDPEHDLGPALQFLTDLEDQPEQIVQWAILASGQLRLSCVADFVSEAGEGDTTVTVEVTPSGGRWSVEVVQSCWPTTPVVARLQALLARLDPALSLSAEQLAALRPTGMAAVLDTFAHIVDVPGHLAHLSRPHQLEVLRRDYADVETFYQLEERANESARFMGGIGFERCYEVDLLESSAWEHRLTFTRKRPDMSSVDWAITESGRLHLTCSGEGGSLTVHVFRQGDGWFVGLEDWAQPTMFLRAQINEVLRRFHPKLSLTPQQVAGVHFVGHRGAIPR